MGNYIEVNDTLQITTSQGFPVELLDLDMHLKAPVTIDDVKGKVFKFQNKPRARVYHLEPVRNFLVHNINGKWLFWGKIQIQSQTISKKLDSLGNWDGESWQTSGEFIISDIYEPEYQRAFTIRESIPGRSYF